MLGDPVLVPPRPDDQVVPPHHPAVLEPLLAGGRVEDDVVDPVSRVRRRQELRPVVDPAPVDARRHGAQQVRPCRVPDVVEPVWPVLQDEHVPVPVDALAGAVVGEGRLAALGVETVEGLLHERLRVGARFSPGDRLWVGGKVRSQLIPARAEEQVAAPHDPGVLLLLLPGDRVQVGVVDPLPFLGGRGEGGAVVEAAPVDALPRCPDQLRAGGVRDRVEAVLALLPHEHVPLAVDALGGVVVGERRFEPFGLVAIERLLHERLRVGAGLGLGRGRAGRRRCRRRPERGGLVPARAEQVRAPTHDPRVLQLLPTRLRIGEAVGDPVPPLRRLREGGAVVEPAQVDALPRRAYQIRPACVGDRVDAVTALFEHEHVPGAVQRDGRVVVRERGLDAFVLVAIECLLDQVDGVLVGVRGRGRMLLVPVLALRQREDAHDECGRREADAKHSQSGEKAALHVRHPGSFNLVRWWR